MRLKVLVEFPYSFTGFDATVCKVGEEHVFSDSFGRYAVTEGLAEPVQSKSLGSSPENKAVQPPPKRKRGRPRKVVTHE